MRGAGAQAVVPVGDTSSMIRMAESCGRQGYRPVWVTPSATDEMTPIPEFEGAMAVTGAFPWFLHSGAPAIAAYASALQQYAPSLLTDGDAYQSWGWQSAELFQAAAAHVSDKPTSQDILRGLWALRGNTLGGLAPGPMARTYTQSQPTPEVYCVFMARIQGGRWTAPQGLTPVCR
jgi:branched-chain amino acid transport system substrate-binding protein